MKNTLKLLAILLASASTNLHALSAQDIDISGTWLVSVDAKDSGKTEGEVRLPGDIASQGFGFKPTSKTRWLGGPKTITVESEKFSKYLKSDGDFKMPFFLQPDMHFIGVASYSKTVNLPQNIGNGRITLTLERPHWNTELFVNGSFAGKCDSLGTPHVFDITKFAKPGANHIVIKVDNSTVMAGLGTFSHSITDSSQGNWNGVAGKMFVSISPKVFLDDAQLHYEGGENNSAKLRVKIANADAFVGECEISVSANGAGGNTHAVPEKKIKLRLSGEPLETDFIFDFGKDAKLWDEFSPNIYNVEIALKSKLGESKKNITYGLRKIEVKDRKIFVNGRETFFRGTLECCLFPLTGYPPADKESWLKLFAACKKYGLNHVRFHSWCPPEAAFEAADESGIYLQAENSNWAHSLNDGHAIDAWIYEETEAMIKAYGNHPSFILYCQGNEPSAKTDEKRDAFLTKWLETYKPKDPRRIYNAGAGFPALRANEYNITAMTRVQKFWGNALKSAPEAAQPSTAFNYDSYVSTRSMPIITHEMGQWCAFPDFRTYAKYTGNLKPRAFDIFMEFMQEAGLENQAHEFMMASGKLQLLFYKADIEADLRTEGLSGFQLLDMRDFPGQGCALVGILDPFWDSKGYADEKDFSKFCGELVPLAILEKLIFTRGEKIPLEIKVSNYSQGELKGAKIKCEVLDASQKIVFSDSFEADVPHGLSSVKKLDIDTANFAAPNALRLKIIVEHGGKNFLNDWNLWCYPEEGRPAAPKGCRVFESADDSFMKTVKSGGKVWLKLKPDMEARIKKYKFGFAPVFWNTLWTEGRLPPETLGLLCNPKHPALKNFPTSFHSDYQWWETIRNASPLDLTGKGVRPIIQVVPDYFTPRNLALAFEVKCGRASVLVTNIDFGAQDANPSLKQLENSFTQYVQSGDFKPSAELSSEDFQKLD